MSFSSAVPVDKPVTNAPLNVILVTQNRVYAGTATYLAGTRSTFVSAFSPLGYKLSLLPSKRFQPFVTGLGPQASLRRSATGGRRRPLRTFRCVGEQHGE